MGRRYNLDDFEDYRNTRNNPLFDSLYREFDRVFRSEDILGSPNLFVEERIKGNKLDENFMKRFDFVQISSIEDLEKELINRPNASQVMGERYFLIGKKGIGKTTLLKHYFSYIADQGQTLSIFLNLAGNIIDDPTELNRKLWENIYESMLDLENDISFYLTNPGYAREVRPEFNFMKDDDVIKDILSNKRFHVRRTLRFLSAKRKIFIVIDNTDELPISQINNILKFSIEMINGLLIRVIFALRDYWSETHLDLGTEFQHCATYLTPPDVTELVKRRFQNIRLPKDLSLQVDMIFKEKGREKSLSKPLTFENTKKIVNSFIDQAFSSLSNKVTIELLNMTNYNVRELLDNIYNFFHSCTLPLRPFFEKHLGFKKRARRLQLSDFIECFMAIHSYCYDYNASRLFNLFDFRGSFESADFRNTLGFVRLLQRLKNGPVNIKVLRRDFTKIGYDKESLTNGLDSLFGKAMIECPDGNNSNLATDINLTRKGRFYLDNIVKEFRYLCFVRDRVPMPKEYHTDIYRRFGQPDSLPGSGDIKNNMDAVYKFVEFLAKEEANEYRINSNKLEVLKRIRGGTLQSLAEQIIQVIPDQIEKIRSGLEQPFVYKDEIRIKEISSAFHMIGADEGEDHRHPYDK